MKRISIVLIITACFLSGLCSCSDNTSRNNRYNAAPQTSAGTAESTRSAAGERTPGDMLPSTNIPDSTYDGAVERAAEGIRDGVDRAADRFADDADEARDKNPERSGHAVVPNE